MNINEAVETIKEWMKPKLKEGVDCPCCGRTCRIYRRKLNSGMAHLMIRLYQKSPIRWTRISRFHSHALLPSFRAFNGDFSYLTHWGLLEHKSKDGSKASGIYRLTSSGRQFVQGLINVPHTVFLLNNECIGKSDKQTDMKTALGNKFDYDELMAVNV